MFRTKNRKACRRYEWSCLQHQRISSGRCTQVRCAACARNRCSTCNKRQTATQAQARPFSCTAAADFRPSNCKAAQQAAQHANQAAPDLLSQQLLQQGGRLWPWRPLLHRCLLLRLLLTAPSAAAPPALLILPADAPAAPAAAAATTALWAKPPSAAVCTKAASKVAAAAAAAPAAVSPAPATAVTPAPAAAGICATPSTILLEVLLVQLALGRIRGGRRASICCRSSTLLLRLLRLLCMLALVATAIAAQPRHAAILCSAALMGLFGGGTSCLGTQDASQRRCRCL